MLPELTPVTLAALALAAGCLAVAGLVAMPATYAVALGGLGTTLIAAVSVKRSGDVKAPKGDKE
jgi:hypothetical protein